MDRPTSAGSSAAIGTIDKRTASNRPILNPSTPTVISLFVTNLRLLDLDLLPDWPSIIVSSFGNHDARTRIRCAEFALFQLVRLYDPATTAEKLRPFFPPLEPLQSINLRAALYRCLNDLKKSGVLGKETVLRKTMLDECQGEKFWELCLGFSAIVLRRVVLAKKRRHGRPVAEGLGAAQTVGRAQKECMPPLAVAHRAALTKVLREKQKNGETYARLYDVLVQKEAELVQRKVKTTEAIASTPGQAQIDRLHSVEQSVMKIWVGSKELRDSLVSGDGCGAGDAMLTKSFDVFWEGHTGAEGKESTADTGLMESLERAAHEQTRRLRRWQSLHEKMLASKGSSVSLAQKTDDSNKIGMKMDRHQDLNMRNADAHGAQQQSRQVSVVSVARYDEILSAMRDELRQNRRATAPPSPAVVAHTTRQVSKGSVHLNTTAGALDPHQRSSSSQDAAPVRPSAGYRVSSRSRSYHQAKVVSQRQPIPLKAEMFSPLKSNHNNASTVSASSSLASPVEMDEMEGNPSPCGGKVSDEVECEGKMDGGIGGSGPLRTTLANEGDKHGRRNEPSRYTSHSINPNNWNDASGSGPRPDFPAAISPQSEQGSVQPSLAERARMSMALRGLEDIPTVLHDPLSTEPALPTAQYIPSEPHLLDRRTSLLDRTRHSISMAPPPPSAVTGKPRPSGHARSRTSVYPTNQFDTPRKVDPGRRSSIDQGAIVGRRDITPREHLFSPDAGYDSVFKARPKIAYSPVLSPLLPDDDEGVEVDVGLEELRGKSPLAAKVGEGR